MPLIRSVKYEKNLMKKPAIILIMTKIDLLKDEEKLRELEVGFSSGAREKANGI